MRSSDPVIVLAAGRGTRMGGPKALMDVDGAPWWTLQTNALARVTDRQVWVVSPSVRSAMGGASVEFVDADADAPMFASLVAGLRHLAAEPPGGVFVLPVDVPAADPGVWSALPHAESPSIPDYNARGGHPVHLPWAWATTHIDLAKPDPAGRLDLLLADQARRVALGDDAVARNLNRPEDLDAYQARESRS